jgi:ABC-type transport system, involved in lipoprotein release, permease component
MFLALQEIKHSKLRYGLVVGVIFLIAYLVFFLTGLAYGLAQESRMAVDKWDASGILLSDEANDNINMSVIKSDDFTSVKASKKASLSQSAGIIYKEDNDKENVKFFGINSKDFLAPNITSGRMFKEANEVVVDDSLSDKGYKLGDIVKVTMSNEALKIVGFTNKAKFSIAPVVYMSRASLGRLKYDGNTKDADINAIVYRGDLKDKPSDLSNLPIKTFINKLPGYSAQVSTFAFMIGFLVVIAAIVIGIFIYVLTMQKLDIFGVMKAQGIPTSYIAKSVLAQTFDLSFIGVILGLLGAYGTSLILPAAVPFEAKASYFIGISILMILTAVLGALFSVKTVVKIDPLKAIS